MPKSRQIAKKVALCAAMTALSVLFCRLLGFPPSGAYRIEIGFFPIAIAAALYGPVWGGVCYGAADLIGAAIFTGINPWITAVKILFGVLLGFLFYPRRCPPVPTALFFLFGGALIDIAAMAPIFVYCFGYTWKAALLFRLLGYAVNTPVRILLCVLALPPVLRVADRVLGKER